MKLSKKRADQEEVEAQEYAATIEAEPITRILAGPIDWKSLNAALIEEYGDAGLLRIKRRAWQIIKERQAGASVNEQRAACGCTFRPIEPRGVPGFPAEAIDTEIAEACRVHEDYALRSTSPRGGSYPMSRDAEVARIEVRDIAALHVVPDGHGFTSATDPYEAFLHGVERTRAAILAILDRSSEAAPYPRTVAVDENGIPSLVTHFPASGAAPVVGLSEAWAKAEAALPEGWWLQVDHGSDPGDCRAQAGPGEWSPSYEPVIVTGQPSPAEALLNLAARLTQTPTLGEAG